MLGHGLILQLKSAATSAISPAAIRSKQMGDLDDLRHKRGGRHLDFAACDVGCCASNADRGHDTSALACLGFDFAPTSHRDTLLDGKAIGAPAKTGPRCHCPDEGGTSATRRGIFFDAERGRPHASIELAAIP